jgi:large subunit ribosomal protein L5
METSFYNRYKSVIVPAMTKRFSYKNTMQVPRIEKVVVNMGVGRATQDSKLLDGAMADLTAITGQKPSMRRSKKAISNFKLRQGMAIGCTVTLRRIRMYEFLQRLIEFALPQVRDFRGLSENSFDGRGNYSLGIREQIIFPEIDYDGIDQERGMDIAIVTSANTDEESKELLNLMGVPFAK